MLTHVRGSEDQQRVSDARQQPQQATELIKSAKKSRISFVSAAMKRAQIPKAVRQKSERSALFSEDNGGSVLAFFNYSLFITATLLLIVFKNLVRINKS